MLAAKLGATNRVVADSGHAMMLYAPEVVAEAIAAIVQRVP